MNNFPIIRPINVYNILRRPPRPLRPHGSRAIHLLHHLFGGAPHSLYELASLRKAELPPADKVSLRLLNGPGNKPATTTLSKVLKNIQPCSYLMQAEEASEERPAGYCINEFQPPDQVKKSRKTGPGSNKYYKRDGRGKECRLTTDCSASLLRHQLSLAYHFLLEGSRMEFHLRPKTRNKFQTVEWALSHRLDLRPESILAAMPKGTTMLALPAVHGPAPPGSRPKSKATTDSIFWALENAAALRRSEIPNTPKRVKELGTWSGNIKLPAEGDRIDLPGFRLSQTNRVDSPKLSRPPMRGDRADLLKSSSDDDSDPDTSPDKYPHEKRKIHLISAFRLKRHAGGK